MKICILSGSPRKNSNTKKLALAIQNQLIKKNFSVNTIDFSEYDIPLMVSGKVDIANLTAFQHSLYTSMSDANLIFVLSPEYNWMPSAELINFFHQMGDKPYASMWKDKTFAVAGVSNGRGGKLPCIQISYVLNKICGFMGFESFVCPRTFESQFTQNVLDGEGKSLGNIEFDNGLEVYINFAVSMAKKMNITK